MRRESAPLNRMPAMLTHRPYQVFVCRGIRPGMPLCRNITDKPLPSVITLDTPTFLRKLPFQKCEWFIFFPYSYNLRKTQWVPTPQLFLNRKALIQLVVFKTQK